MRSSVNLLVAFLLFLPASAFSQNTKPKVAILVYDGVQVIDHAIPFEVFGQFSLNEVYTVAKSLDPLTTYMGMRILPNYSFDEAPIPDVLVLPGGNAGDAQKDPQIRAWIERTAKSADHVLTICTGIFFLAGNDLLDGKRMTTWYARQEDLRQSHPGAHVVGNEIVVESGKLVSAAGLGMEGALRVLDRLHGPGWAEIVRLNMEYEPVPDSLRTPRIELADLLLPDGIYAAFPWREAELLQFEGDRKEWTMAWRYHRATSFESLRSEFLDALGSEQRWTLTREEIGSASWTSMWCVQDDEAENGQGQLVLKMQGSQIDLEVHVSVLGGGTKETPCSADFDDVDPVWSPDGKRIAFYSNRNGNFDIYLVNADGTDLTRITDDPAYDGSPSWSPDGNRLAFASKRDGQRFNLYTMRPDGTDLVLLTDTTTSDLASSWSPDGKQIVYESDMDGAAELAIVSVDGASRKRLTNDDANDFRPAWSPDGTRIAFQSSRDGKYAVFMMDPDGSNVSRITDLTAHNLDPVFSPDGSHLAFVSDRDGNSEIYVMRSDGTQAKRLTHDAGRDHHPSWSPDGSRLVFYSNRTGHFALFTMDASGQNLKPLIP